MALVGLDIQPAVMVEGENVEGAPDDADRLPLEWVDGDVAHAHPASGKAQQRVLFRRLQHRLEGSRRQPVQAVVQVEHEHAAGQSQRFVVRCVARSFRG